MQGQVAAHRLGHSLALSWRADADRRRQDEGRCWVTAGLDSLHTERAIALGLFAGESGQVSRDVDGRDGLAVEVQSAVDRLAAADGGVGAKAGQRLIDAIANEAAFAPEDPPGSGEVAWSSISGFRTDGDEGRSQRDGWRRVAADEEVPGRHNRGCSYGED